MTDNLESAKARGGNMTNFDAWYSVQANKATTEKDMKLMRAAWAAGARAMHRDEIRELKIELAGKEEVIKCLREDVSYYRPDGRTKAQKKQEAKQ